MVVEGLFAKSELDPEFVAAEEARVTGVTAGSWNCPGRAYRSPSTRCPRSGARWQDPTVSVSSSRLRPESRSSPDQ